MISSAGVRNLGEAVHELTQALREVHSMHEVDDHEGMEGSLSSAVVAVAELIEESIREGIAESD